MFHFVLYIFVVYAINIVLGAKILGVFPVPSPSHRNFYKPIMDELVKKGHCVSIISPFEETFVNRSILLGFADWIRETMQKEEVYKQVDRNTFYKIKASTQGMTQIAEMTLADKNVQKLIKSRGEFDLVIITGTANYAHHTLASHFEVPLIVLSTMGSNYWMNQVVGNSNTPSYFPNMFTGYYKLISFLERVINSAVFLYTQIQFYVYLFPAQNKMIKKYVPGGASIDQVVQNASLALLNSHPIINQPVPYVPNMIDIGGSHIKPPKKLPPDLQEFLDEAKHGVIYFSMGSNLRSSELPPDKREAFLKTFSKLKQKILWKWEENVLPEHPANVKLGKWLPQQDILAHPNLKLFITHGGLLSTIETVHYGVPVLAIPIFADQLLNAEIVVNQGLGLSLTFSNISEENLTPVIDELLKNKRYMETVKYRSKLFRDRTNAPLNTAIYWIEYVIRNKGATHLRVTGLDLSWYEYLLLDVLLFVASTLVLVFYIFNVFLRKCLSYVRVRSY